MKYHPTGDDRAPASASSGRDSVLKWSKCSFFELVNLLKFGEGERIRKGNASNTKRQIQRNGEVNRDPFSIGTCQAWFAIKVTSTTREQR